MLIYNITFSVEDALVDEWLPWTKKVLMPAYDATGFFEECSLFRILHGNHDGQQSFCLHLKTPSRKTLAQFHQLHHEPLVQLINETYGERCLIFDTILEQLS